MLFEDFSKAFDPLHTDATNSNIWSTKRKCYRDDDALKNTKATGRSPVGDTTFFDIFGGVLQGDTLATCKFIIYPDYVFQTIYLLKKLVSHTKDTQKYSSETMTYADYEDALSLLANTPVKPESLLDSLEHAAEALVSI